MSTSEYEEGEINIANSEDEELREPDQQEFMQTKQENSGATDYETLQNGETLYQSDVTGLPLVKLTASPLKKVSVNPKRKGFVRSNAMEIDF